MIPSGRTSPPPPRGRACSVPASNSCRRVGSGSRATPAGWDQLDGPGLSAIRRLSAAVAGDSLFGVLPLLVQCPHLTALRELKVFGERVGASSARVLASAAVLPRLRRLALEVDGADPVVVLSAAPGADSLAALRLICHGEADEAMRRLAIGTHLLGLEELDLSNNGLGPAAELLAHRGGGAGPHERIHH